MRKISLFLAFALLVSVSVSAQRDSKVRGSRSEASVQKKNYKKDNKNVVSSSSRPSVCNNVVSDKKCRTSVTNKKSTRPNSNKVNSGYKIVRHGNSTYYHDGHNYYRKNGLNYSYCYPPAGLRISSVPLGYKVVKHSNKSYYYCDGIVYEPIRSGVYSVVTPVVGMLLPSLPLSFARSVTRGGKHYYSFAGMLYSKVNYRGSVAYRVIGAY